MKSGSNTGQQHNPTNQGSNGRRKGDNSLDLGLTPIQIIMDIDVRESSLHGSEGQVLTLSGI